MPPSEDPREQEAAERARSLLASRAATHRRWAAGHPVAFIPVMVQVGPEFMAAVRYEFYHEGPNGRVFEREELVPVLDESGQTVLTDNPMVAASEAELAASALSREHGY